MYLYVWTFVNSLKGYSHQLLPFCKWHPCIDKNYFWSEILQYFFLTFQDLIWGFLFNPLFVNKSWPPYFHKMHTKSQNVSQNVIFLVTTSFSFFIQFKKQIKKPNQQKKKIKFNLIHCFKQIIISHQLFQKGNALPDREERLHQGIDSPLPVWAMG